MNVDNLISFLENEEQYDEKAISQIMVLIEKYPYFQLGHMMLLKAMKKINPEKYNKQLKISGSFISDKRKLFQFVNTDLTEIITTKEETDEIFFQETKTEKVEKVEKIIKKEEEKRIEIPIIDQGEKKNEIEISTQIEKKETTAFDQEQTKKEIEKEPEKTLEKKETIIKKKVDLPEDEIERIADENSKLKHHKIIKDFFHGQSQMEKKVIESDQEEKKEEIKESSQPVVKSNRLKELLERKKQEEEKAAKSIEELKTSVAEKKEVESPVSKNIITKNLSEEKKSVEPIKKQEIELEKPKIQEIKKEPPVIKKLEETQKTDNSEDTMTNIFSKIRQIKREMNLSSESTPETIDINPEEKGSLLQKTKKTEEKTETPEVKKSTGGKVIKESFIGFSDEQVKVDPEDNDDNKKEQDETEKIKESELTAKDLFKKYMNKKGKSIDTEKKSDDYEKITNSKSPISKLVEIVNQEETETGQLYKKKEIEEKKTEPVNKEEEPVIFRKTESVSNTTKSSSGAETAADALLKRIADKRKKMKEESELEEQRKREEKQKELDAINELMKAKSKTELIEEPLKEENKIKNSDIPEIDEKEETEIIQKKTNKLIDSFIERSESLERIGSKESKLVGDISESSTLESEDIMTETYADLLIQQKNYKKAIDVYNKLILKFPEKKTYFAIQIKKVESLIK